MRANQLSLVGLSCYFLLNGCLYDKLEVSHTTNAAGRSGTQKPSGGRGGGTGSDAAGKTTIGAGATSSDTSGGMGSSVGGDGTTDASGGSTDTSPQGNLGGAGNLGGNASVVTPELGGAAGNAGGARPFGGASTAGGASNPGGAPHSGGTATPVSVVNGTAGTRVGGGGAAPAGGVAPTNGGSIATNSGGQVSAGGTTQKPECIVVSDCQAPTTPLDQCHQLACNSGRCEAVAKTGATCTSPGSRSGLCSSGGVCAVCTADAYICESDTLYHCPLSQIDYDIAGKCGAGLCDATAHKCNGCIAGTSWCDPSDNTKSITCGSDGKSQTTGTSPGKYCVASGTGVKWVDCITDEQCPDVVLPACIVKACGSDNKCTTKNSLQGQTCTGGSCDGAGKCLVCAAGDYHCTGTPALTLEHCSADRTGWTKDADCASAALCSAPAKQCLKCEKSKVWCSNSSTREECSADGLTQTTTSAPSTSTPICTGAGRWVACLADSDCSQPSNPCQQVTCNTSTNACNSPTNRAANATCAGNGRCDSAGTCIGPSANSCLGGLTCQGRSCCESRLVVGGTFPMGRGSGTDACPSGAGFTCNSQGYETPEHNATISSFYLDTFEVTIGRFRTFQSSYTRPSENAGANPRVAASNPSYSSTGWSGSWGTQLPTDGSDLGSAVAGCTNSTWPPVTGGEANENRAVNCVTWYEAFAFCIWDGGRLPTAAEWEYAAAGGSNNYLYPWGSAVTDGTRCNCAGNDNRSLTMIVGSFSAGAGVFGQRDLAGSFEEWVLDWAASDWYGGSGASCTNCVDLRSATLRMTRGGSYAGTGSSAAFLRAAAVNGYTPATRDYRVGIRCARDTSP